jgi:predicted ABC-type ATPase
MKLALMMKAQRRGDLVPVKKQVTRGGKSFTQTVWVSPGDAAKTGGGKGGAAGPDKKPVGQRYGMHNIEAGDTVTFEGPDGKKVSGVVSSAGKDGVIIGGARGHPVYWKDIRGFKPKAGTKKPEYNDRFFNKKKEYIEPEKFNAVQWKKQFDDAVATADSVLNSFEDKDKIIKAISDTEERLKRLEQTISWYRREGKDDKAVYAPERNIKHFNILTKILSPSKIRAARPKKGEKPTFIILGGRGGSGKGWFEDNVYNPKKAIVLDADKIKSKFPEYEGWNAAQVHEESSDLLERILKDARDMGLNVVLDATMKTAKSAINKVKTFKDAGYQIEAHYMHLPRQEAAKRAVSRFMGKDEEGRYVPIDVVLQNTTNEETFDLIKDMADRWSFRDNNVSRGEEPILISESKK